MNTSDWAFSSNGRALASHARGTGIDTPKVQYILKNLCRTEPSTTRQRTHQRARFDPGHASRLRGMKETMLDSFQGCDAQEMEALFLNRRCREAEQQT